MRDFLGEYLATTDAACPGCGYNLRGLMGSVCPECGAAVELGLRGEERSLARWRRTVRNVYAAAVACELCLVAISVVRGLWYYRTALGLPGRYWSYFAVSSAVEALTGTVVFVLLGWPVVRLRPGLGGQDGAARVRRALLGGVWVILLVTLLSVVEGIVYVCCFML